MEAQIILKINRKQLDKDLDSIDKKISETGEDAGENISNSYKEKMKIVSETVDLRMGQVQEKFRETGNKIEDSIVSPMKAVSDTFKDNLAVVTSFSSILLGSIKVGNSGFVSLIGKLGAVSGGLQLAAIGTKSLNKELSSLLSIGSVIFGGLSALLTIALFKIADLSYEIGTNLVNSSKEATKQFLKFSASVLGLNSIISNYNKLTVGAIGSTESWNEEVSKLSQSLNISQTSLNKSAQEIVSVGSKLGLAEKQLKKLLKVSSEYAKVNSKEVFPTTLAVVNALSGNTQAIQAYGVKLNQAALQQYAYSSGLNESINKLSESEKVQLRYNLLMKQYKGIQGVATTISESYSDSTARLETNVERLNIKLGEGAALIESNQIVASALGGVLDNVNGTVVKSAGFVKALLGRFLQFTGIIVSFTLKVLLIVKVYKLFNYLLKSSLGIKVFTKNLKVLNGTLDGTIRKLTLSNKKIRSNKMLFSQMGRGFVVQSKKIARSILGVKSNTIGVGSVLKSLIVKFALLSTAGLAAFKTIGIVIAPFLIKFALIAGVVVGGVVLIKRSFELLEERTKVFSRTFEILFGKFSIFKDVAKELGELFLGIAKIIKNVFNVAIGAASYLIARLTEDVITLLLKMNSLPLVGGFLDPKKASKLKAVTADLANFSSGLAKVGYNMAKLPDIANRAIASIKDAPKEVNLQDWYNLQETIDNIGKSSLDKLREQFNERLTLLTDVRNADLVDEERYQLLKTKLTSDFEKKRNDIVNKGSIQTYKTINRTFKQGIVNVVKSSMVELGKSLAGAGQGFQSFSAVILGIMGDIAIAIGSTIIASAKAMEALKLALGPAGTGLAAIALGGALVVLGGILKGASSNMGGTSATATASTTGTTGGIASTPEQLGEVYNPQDEDILEKTETTQINVNIKGDVLDSDESGTRIVQIINDAFDKEGIVINQAFA